MQGQSHSFQPHGIIRRTRVVGSLNGLIDDSVANAQSVEVESHSGDRSVADQFVVLVEVLVESWTIVSVSLKSVRITITQRQRRPELTLRSSQWPS
jgi:hypothetical protein